MRRRAPLPLLLALAGTVQHATSTWTEWQVGSDGWVGAIGSGGSPGVLAAVALLFCPGWGLLRCLSSIDRTFGVCGAALTLSLLVLGLATRLAPAGAQTAAFSLGLHALSVVLCLAGTWRLARHDRRMAALPPHPAPMQRLPERWVACLVLAGAALLATIVASPLGAPPSLAGSETLAQAVDVQALISGQPAHPGETSTPRGMLAPAAAAHAVGAALHPLQSVGLVLLTALLATLLLAAECCSRLWGNQGAYPALLVVLLGLHPLAFITAGFGDDHTPRTGGLLAPFIAHQQSALACAFMALLMTTTLSVIRRSSRDVPRLVGVAACGLVLTLPEATLLWWPGWVLGAWLAHLACRGSPDNHDDSTNPWRRPGDPRILRAPFWRLVLPLTAGTICGLLLSGYSSGFLSGSLANPLANPMAAHGSPSATRLGLALLAWGPAALLILPGIRSLHAAPGREAFFYVGLLTCALPALVLFELPTPEFALPVGITLLWLPLAIASGIAVARLTARPRRIVRLALLLAVVLAWPSTGQSIARSLHAEHPIQLLGGELQSVRVSIDEAAAWQPFRDVAELALPPALLVARPGDVVSDPDWLRLITGLTLLPLPSSTLPTGSAPRAALTPDATRYARAAHLLRQGRHWPLRSLPGVGSVDLWAVTPNERDHPEVWPGFRTVAGSGRHLLMRAPAPDVVLVTVTGLGFADLDALPRLTAAVRRRGVITSVLATAPDLSTGLDQILAGSSSGDLVARLRDLGWSTVALLAQDASASALAPRLAGFDLVEARSHTSLPRRLERALDVLTSPAPQPRCLWWHADDLALPLRAPTGASGERPWPSARHDPALSPALTPAQRKAGRQRRRRLLGELDLALTRLLQSLDLQDVFILTAPLGRHAWDHDAAHGHGLEPGPGTAPRTTSALPPCACPCCCAAPMPAQHPRPTAACSPMPTWATSWPGKTGPDGSRCLSWARNARVAR